MAIEHARNSKLNVCIVFYFSRAICNIIRLIFQVESFIVGEDFASGQRSIAGKRGMCGLLYTYKVKFSNLKIYGNMCITHY